MPSCGCDPATGIAPQDRLDGSPWYVHAVRDVARRLAPWPIPSTPPRSGAGCSPPGPTRRRASGRTPTPRRTWSAAATATGCWSSWPRTPPTPRAGPAVPGRLRLELAGRDAARGQHRRAAGRRGRAGAGHAARLGQAGRGRHRRAGSASASPRSWRSATSPRWCRRPAACGSAPAGTRAEVAAAPGLGGGAGAPGRRGARAAAARGRPTGTPPEGFATEVVLPLRAGARAAVAAALEALPGELLLALPGLADVEIVVDGRRRALSCGAERRTGTRDHRRRRRRRVWPVAQRSGELPAELVADRPVEERERRAWTVTWAVPLDPDGRPRPLPAGQVVHAPTPSDEPLSLPARLIAPFPLGPDRRHVAPGPVTDALVAAAADDLRRPADRAPGRPRTAGARAPHRAGRGRPRRGAGLGGAGPAARRRRGCPWRRRRTTSGRPPTGPRCWTTRPTSGSPPWPASCRGCCPPAGPGGPICPALTALGVRRIGIAEAVEAVRGVDAAGVLVGRALRRPRRRRPRGARRAARAAGRRAHGTRPGRGAPARSRAAGRPAGPARACAWPIPRSLGPPAGPPAARAPRRAARHAPPPSWPTPRCGRPSRRRWTRSRTRCRGAPDPGELAEAVLALVAAARPAVGELPWLAELALPDDDGGWAPAGELVLPGSPLAAVLEPGSLGMLEPSLRGRGRPRTRCVPWACSTRSPSCARRTPTTWTWTAPIAWADAVLDRLPHDAPPPEWPPLIAVRDLELVRDWHRALPLLAAASRPTSRADVVLGGVTRSPATCGGGSRPTRCSTGSGRTGCGSRTARSYRDCTNRRPVFPRR